MIPTKKYNLTLKPVIVVVFLTISVMICQSQQALATSSGVLPVVGTTPGSNPTSYNWQHARLDENELKKIGGGSLEKGMNLLGAEGYALFIVTSVIETGQAGFHYFKRPPWNRPAMRPQYEYKRIDSKGIQKIGNGSFIEGLVSVEEENWELITVTSTKNGSVGYHYFLRAKMVQESQ